MTLTELKEILQQMIEAGHGEECLYFIDQDNGVYLVNGLDSDDEGSLLLSVEEDAEEGLDIETLYEALSEVDDEDEHDLYLWDENSELYCELDGDWDVDEDGSPFMSCEYLIDDEDDEYDEDDSDCEDCDDEDCEDCEDCDCEECDCEDCDCEDDEDCCGCEDDEDVEDEEDEDDDSSEELDDDDYYADAEDD